MVDGYPKSVPRLCMLGPPCRRRSVRCDELTKAGWHVLAIDDIHQAIAAVRAGAVDLLVVQQPFDQTTDVNLPDILEELLHDGHVPVVFLTNRADDTERAELLNSGAAEVIAESTPTAEFIARLRAQLRVKQLREALALSRRELERALARERCLLAKLRRDAAELQELSTVDLLTHTQNVRSFRDILAHEFKVSVRYNQPLSLLMLDADHFKLINDTCGHPTGDYVLKELAAIFHRHVRRSDVVARTGGEEFGIILPGAGPKQANKFAQRIRKEIAAHRFAVYGHQLRVTVSIGYTSYPADTEIHSPRMMVCLAEQALQIAKGKGRNRVVAFRRLAEDIRKRLVRQHAPSSPDERAPLAVTEVAVTAG